MKWLLCVILAVGTQAFLFPSSGGGGCGGGCGGGGTSSCLPSLGCSQMCFSIPTLKLPTPCAAPAAPACGCGGKRKKRSIPEGATETCSDPKLRKIILEHIQNEPTESRTKIVSALHTEFKDERFLVACTSGSDQKFATSSDYFCVDGTPSQTCYVFALEHGEVAEETKEEKAEDEPKENEKTEEEAVDDSKEEKDEPKSEDEIKEEAKEDSKEAEEAKDEAKEVEDAKDEEAKEAEEAKDEPEETKEEEKEEEKEEKEDPKEEEKEEDAKDEEAATEEKDE